MADKTQDVLELAAELGIPAAERPFPPSALSLATEAFITSTTREVMPVVRIDDRPVGPGAPGGITRRLLDAYRASVRQAV